MPPSVACAEVETSTGNHRPCVRSCALSWSSTMPGWTSARRALRRRLRARWLRCFELSITSAAPTVCPHCEVPAPRGRTGTPSSHGDLHARSARVRRARHHHADGLDLVDRGVGGVASAARRIEQHFAVDLAPRGRSRAACQLGAVG